MDNEIFYMVFIEGGNTPAYGHRNKSDAEIECRRLVEKTGKKGYVLQSVKSIQLTPKFIENDLSYADIPY